MFNWKGYFKALGVFFQLSAFLILVYGFYIWRANYEMFIIYPYQPTPLWLHNFQITVNHAGWVVGICCVLMFIVKFKDIVAMVKKVKSEMDKLDKDEVKK